LGLLLKFVTKIQVLLQIWQYRACRTRTWALLILLAATWVAATNGN
jgi:hypothetical protein